MANDQKGYPPHCELCQKGFPVNERGEHYGTQALGMIQNTPCVAAGDAWLKEIAERIGKGIEKSEHIERALVDHSRDGDFKAMERDIADLRTARLAIAQMVVEHRDYIMYGLTR
jgi:hypothetical protein